MSCTLPACTRLPIPWLARPTPKNVQQDVNPIPYITCHPVPSHNLPSRAVPYHVPRHPALYCHHRFCYARGRPAHCWHIILAVDIPSMPSRSSSHAKTPHYLPGCHSTGLLRGSWSPSPVRPPAHCSQTQAFVPSSEVSPDLGWGSADRFDQFSRLDMGFQEEEGAVRRIVISCLDFVLVELENWRR